MAKAEGSSRLNAMPAKLFSCFAPPAPHATTSGTADPELSTLQVQRVNNKKTFDRILHRARATGALVLVEWAANWCSISLEADLEFAKLAGLDREGQRKMKFVRVNLDRAEDLALEYKVITLPSFSIFQDGQLIEHYTGLESCRIMHKRLQSQDSNQEDESPVSPSNRIDFVVSHATDSGDWDTCTCSTSSSESTTCGADISESRSSSLEWNSYAPSLYLPRYNRESLRRVSRASESHHRPSS